MAHFLRPSRAFSCLYMLPLSHLAPSNHTTYTPPHRYFETFHNLVSYQLSLCACSARTILVFFLDHIAAHIVSCCSVLFSIFTSSAVCYYFSYRFFVTLLIFCRRPPAAAGRAPLTQSTTLSIPSNQCCFDDDVSTKALFLCGSC